MRTHTRSHNSRVALAGLGLMAALVALASDAQPTRPADAAVRDRGASRTIEDIDFASVAQSGTTCDEGVRDRAPLLVAVEGGSSKLLDTGSLARLEVDAHPLYGDLDGDGDDEAVVSVTCNYGANGAQDTVQVWAIDGNRPVVVDRVTEAPAEVADESRFPPTVADVARDGAELAVTFTVHADDDPNCCPSQQAVVRYQLDDGDLAVVGRPVVGPVEG